MSANLFTTVQSVANPRSVDFHFFIRFQTYLTCTVWATFPCALDLRSSALTFMLIVFSAS